VPSAVAFLDGLGTKVAARQPERAQELLVALVEATEGTMPGLRLEESLEHIHCQVFSDSLCLSVPDPGASGLQALTLSAARVQGAFALRGVFLRGAITLGDHYQSGTVSFGAALVDAYELERDIAKQPRVILADAPAAVAVDRCNSRDQILPLAIDQQDGVLFVDFLQLFDALTLRTLRRHIVRKQREAAASVDAAETDAAREGIRNAKRTLAKYVWLARYFNWRAATSQPIPIPAEPARFTELTSIADWRRQIRNGL
jgi:hypothetical protein